MTSGSSESFFPAKTEVLDLLALDNRWWPVGKETVKLNQENAQRIVIFNNISLIFNFMEHQMKLFSAGFYGIKEGKQIIEVRLNDDKRRAINLGDRIKFSLLPDLKEEFKTEVVGLLKYQSFRDLFSDISLSHWNASNWTIDQAVAQCYKYYPKEDEKKYGVLGIRIKTV